MLGKTQVRQENLFFPPRQQATGKHNLLRQINKNIDFTAFREKAAPYFSDTGRPSIDPVAMLKMMVLGYLFDIRSDRMIVEEVIDRDSFREFVGYGCDENIPTHANFTRWRQRIGPEVFKDFLLDILSQCKAAGMRLGNCRLFDSTRVKARASTNSPAKVELEPETQPQEYLDAFDWQEDNPHGRKLVVNTNDPEARLIRHGNEPSRFVHKVHMGVDSKTGLITNVMASHKPDYQAMIEFLRREEGIDCIGADKGYSATECFRELEAMGIKAFIPVLDHSNDKGDKYHLSDFTYRMEDDTFICPAGKTLRMVCAQPAKRRRMYAANQSDCAQCPLRDRCTSGKRRTLTVSADRPLIEKVKFYARLPRYARVMSRRKAVMEGTFAHAKAWCGMSRARGVGREAMDIQATLVAAVINVKKLLAHLGKGSFSSLKLVFVLPRRLSEITQGLMWSLQSPTRSELVKVQGYIYRPATAD
jgi:transposase